MEFLLNAERENDHITETQQRKFKLRGKFGIIKILDNF